MKTKTRFLLATLLGLASAFSARAFVPISPVSTWLPGYISFQVKLGTATTYTDGTNATTSLQAAMATWNGVLGAVQFVSTASSDTTSSSTNSINEIIFSSTVEGAAYGANVLAVTLSSTYPSVHERVESDILFNTAYTWDSYRGARKTNPDIRRVGLHELGHVLGLDHPDDFGQSVTATMNSRISDLDTLAADDIAGVQSLYGLPGNTSPPANDAFANAIAITLTSNAAIVTGSNIYATKETNESKHAGENGGHSVWWKWTATAAGSMTITLDGSRFDTVMGVYTGTSVAASALTIITSNDDTSRGSIRYSTVTFTAVAGTTYMIAVDGWEGESGYVQMNLTFTPAGTLSAPSITTHPTGVGVGLGGTAIFTATASGTPTPALRWQRQTPGSGTWADLFDSGTYSGTATSTLTITNATLAMNGDKFRMTATNSSGTVSTNSATLGVTATSDVGRLINLSVRTNAGLAEETLLVGFVIGGAGTSGPKATLIRGVGPTLIPFGVPGAILDPNIDLILQSTGAVLQSNDDWGGGSQLNAAFNQVGAFDYQSPTSKDSALISTYGNGVYAVKITGKGGTTGISLAEIYDATLATSFTATTPRLINVSARTKAGTGEGVLIVGFVIGGSTPCRVMIRAVGPTLAQYLSGTLDDPKLTLFQRVNGTDTEIGSNDNWNDAANAATVVTVSAQIGAFSLANGTKDAVLLVTLQPGIYSAKVTGANNTTGIALVEVYEAP